MRVGEMAGAYMLAPLLLRQSFVRSANLGRTPGRTTGERLVDHVAAWRPLRATRLVQQPSSHRRQSMSWTEARADRAPKGCEFMPFAPSGNGRDAAARSTPRPPPPGFRSPPMKERTPVSPAGTPGQNGLRISPRAKPASPAILRGSGR
jgi:hypothetical protein